MNYSEIVMKTDGAGRAREEPTRGPDGRLEEGQLFMESWEYKKASISVQQARGGFSKKSVITTG